MAGLAIAFGSGAMTNSVHEIREMGEGDTIFVTGSNTTECHPIIGVYMLQARERGAKLIVADPRRIELAKAADLWMRQKPGTDVAMFNGMMNVIINENLIKESFIAERTESYEDCKNTVMKYTPDYVSSITTIPAEDIIKAARIFAKAENASIYYTMGITQHTTGVDNVLCIANLAMMTGNLGRKKAGVNPLRGQNNVQGACDMGALPVVYTGYQPVSAPEAQEKFEKAWGVKLSNKPGTTIPDALSGLEKGTIKALYILGENPVRSDADINHVKHCMQNVDTAPIKQSKFIVVQDIFLTETAELADVVLPGASFAEKDGTFVNTERKVQRVRKAVPPVGKPDWQIFTELIKAMGFKAPYSSPEDVFEEIRTVTPSYAGISYKRLEGGGIPWPCPAEDHPGTPILHVGKFTRGLGKFNSVEFKPPAENPDAEYPLILTTGRSGAHYHTGTITRRSWGLNMVHPEEALEINPVDAKNLGINAGDAIKVSSRRGNLITKANVTDRVAAGTTFITFHFTETPGNLLTNTAADPISKTPELKVCAVKVEKAKAV